MSKYDESLNSICKSARCEEVDRVPVASCDYSCFARTGKIEMKEDISNLDL